MIRYFLAKGDRAGSAVIIEGLPDCTCSDPPPQVEIATLNMKTWCAACKREGFIAPQGPRWPGTASNGQQWALSGDINVCDCSPPPVFYAERGMSMTFTAKETASFITPSPRSCGSEASTPHEDSGFDRHFRFVDERGDPVTNIRVQLTDANGRATLCNTDHDGRTPKITGSEGQKIAVSLSGGNAQ